MMDVLAAQATLNTFSVTIQALMVSGKQMTLAVFRQLPIASPIEDSGVLNNFRFWGLVRYSIKDQGDEWAVAEADGKLFRCPLWTHYQVERNEMRSVLNDADKKASIARNAYESAVKSLVRMEQDQKEHPEWNSVERWQERLLRAQETKQINHANLLHELASLKVVHDDFLLEVEKIGARRTSFARLRDLNQLFIAV